MSTQAKLPEIERLRAVAALLVLVVHCEAAQAILPRIFGDPWSGVDLFFVISGYVVTLSLLRLLPSVEGEASFLGALHASREALKTFYVRRFFRIMPAALGVALLHVLLSHFFPVEFGSARELWPELWAFLGGVYNYFQAFHVAHLNVYWSLAVEEHFYLLLPLLFVVLRTTNRRLLGCAVLASVSIVGRFLPDPVAEGITQYDRFASHLRFDSLMAGVALALVRAPSTTAAIMPRRWMRWVILPGILVAVAAMPRALPQYPLNRVGLIALWMFSGVLVSYAALDQGYVFSFPVVGRVLEVLGARSYAIYLVHMIVKRLEMAARVYWPRYAELAPDADHPWRRVLVFLVGTLLAAELLHRGVERPFLRIGRRLIEERRPEHVLSGVARALLVAALALGTLAFFRHGLLRLVGPRDLALHARVTTSSVEKDAPTPERLTDGALESDGAMRTASEKGPWAVIDLGETKTVGAIRLYNSSEELEEQQAPLDLAVSTDGAAFEVVGRRATVFTRAMPWRVPVAHLPVRYIRIQLAREGALSLSEVEVYEPTWMARVP